VPAQPHGPGSTPAAAWETGCEAADADWLPVGGLELVAATVEGLKRSVAAHTSGDFGGTDVIGKGMFVPSHDSQSQQPRRSIVARASWQASQMERVWRFICRLPHLEEWA
jgi:hypothetical protein